MASEKIEREIGPEASFDARWDFAALNIVNQIWQIPAEWPPARRKAHAQILIIEALKAADALSNGNQGGAA